MSKIKKKILYRYIYKKKYFKKQFLLQTPTLCLVRGNERRMYKRKRIENESLGVRQVIPLMLPHL
jgi:hypothetical protein